MASISTVSLAAGPTTRTWHVQVGGRSHAVQLFHNTLLGERALSIDGAEVAGTAGSSTLLGGRKTLLFTLAGQPGEVTISWSATAVHYACRYAGADLAEENALLGGARGDAGGGGAGAGAGDDAEASLAQLKVAVDVADVAADEAGKPVVWFRVHTVRETDQREVCVHRRFRDFFANHEALRSAYKGSHLLASLPDLPPRTLAGSLLSSLFGATDHLDPAFINERRWKLQDYLFKMAAIPRMRGNPDFLTFLGCVDGVREVSVLFPRDVALGLSLRAAGGYVEVTGLKPLADGSKSPAQTSGLVKAGDKVRGRRAERGGEASRRPPPPPRPLLCARIPASAPQISKINGEPVLGESYEVIVAQLKSLPRPLMIHFLGLFESREARPDDSSQRFEAADLRPAAASTAAAASSVAAAGDGAVGTITGLTGNDVSFLGTGATPRPSGTAARSAGPAAAGLFDAGGLC